MKIHNVTQGSPEWHALRARCRNASELAAVRGRSKYQKRTDLIRIKATGITPDIDDATQRLFDRGHEAEAKARAIVEQMIGEDLYPVVATTDDEYLLASSDGSNMLGSLGFEHKLLSESLVAQIRAGQLDPHYTDQMDQQFAVFGFEKIIFACSDGTPENFYSMEYTGNPESIARIRADWAQFDEDVANYQHVEVAEKPTGAAPESLPALRIDVTGAVTFSNLPAFKSHALAVIGSIKTDLQTDQDFADAEKTVKWLKDVEDKLKQAKQNALEQTESIDLLFKAIDEIASQAASTRLNLDKKVKSEKELRKLEAVRAVAQEFDAHCSALRHRVGVSFAVIVPNFAEVIKGLKTIDSMRDKLSAALANGKVDASALADRIEANRKTVDDMTLLPDFANVCTKAPDDFAALLALRKQQRQEAEADRARREAEHRANVERINAEQAAAERRPTEPETQTVAAVVTPAIANDCSTTIKLGEICARLGFTVTADFLAGLGISPVATDKNAKLYDANKFPTICRLISDHVMALAFKKAA